MPMAGRVTDCAAGTCNDDFDAGDCDGQLSMGHRDSLVRGDAVIAPPVLRAELGRFATDMQVTQLIRQKIAPAMMVVRYEVEIRLEYRKYRKAWIRVKDGRGGRRFNGSCRK